MASRSWSCCGPRANLSLVQRSSGYSQTGPVTSSSGSHSKRGHTCACRKVSVLPRISRFTRRNAASDCRQARSTDSPANPVWLAAVQREVPAEMLARVSAYDWLVSLGAQLLGFAVGPALTQLAGFTWPLSAAAALVVITLLVPASLPSVRGLRLSPV
jgi:hypothetical protein